MFLFKKRTTSITLPLFCFIGEGRVRRKMELMCLKWHWHVMCVIYTYVCCLLLMQCRVLQVVTPPMPISIKSSELLVLRFLFSICQEIVLSVMYFASRVHVIVIGKKMLHLTMSRRIYVHFCKYKFFIKKKETKLDYGIYYLHSISLKHTSL